MVENLLLLGNKIPQNGSRTELPEPRGFTTAAVISALSGESVITSPVGTQRHLFTLLLQLDHRLNAEAHRWLKVLMDAVRHQLVTNRPDRVPTSQR